MRLRCRFQPQGQVFEKYMSVLSDDKIAHEPKAKTDWSCFVFDFHRFQLV